MVNSINRFPIDCSRLPPHRSFAIHDGTKSALYKWDYIFTVGRKFLLEFVDSGNELSIYTSCRYLEFHHTLKQLIIGFDYGRQLTLSISRSGSQLLIAGGGRCAEFSVYLIAPNSQLGEILIK